MKFIFVIFTFWDVDNEERPKRPGPADALYPSLSQAGVDADVEDGESEDGDDHQVLSVAPEHAPLTEEELVSEPK